MITLDFSELIKNNELNKDILRDLLLDIQTYINKQKDFSTFKYFEINEKSAVVNRVIKHFLNYQPKDTIILSVTPSTSVVTFHPENYTNENVVYSATPPCVIRFLLGTYKE
jgi:hypothetical protein